jgi:predicted AlkP superfamily pyrophosphatase or phosphodiesterase
VNERSASASAKRAVLMVWDGMRPDLIGAELTPNLARLADDGVFFEASHAVFPTVTRINSASIASGAYPVVHGLPGNVLYAPLVDPAAPISLGEAENVAALRETYGVFAAPTTADVMARAGGRTVVVSSGTRGSALMCDPNLRTRGDLMLHPTLSTPEELRPVVGRLGPLPPAEAPNIAQNRWFADAIAGYVLPELRPELLIVWHNDPDKSQHLYGFGHPESMRSIRSADEHLGMILEALERQGLRDETIVAVASDHGYVTLGERVDLVAALVEAGLKESPGSTDVVVAPNGGAVMVYVPNGSEAHVERVADFLRAWEPCAVLFSKRSGDSGLEGTFPLASVGIDGPLAPDLLLGLAWTDDANEYGHAGISAECGGTNQASHGGLSSWEIRNTLILSGAGARRAVRSDLPAGNVDIAPTLLALLGQPIPESMQGRVLSEALVGGEADVSASREVAHVEHDGVQTELHWSSVAGRRYLDYGQRVS